MEHVRLSATQVKLAFIRFQSAEGLPSPCRDNMRVPVQLSAIHTIHCLTHCVFTLLRSSQQTEGVGA